MVTTFIEVDGIRHFGQPVAYDPVGMRLLVQAMTLPIRAELHLVRHFASIPDSCRERLVGSFTEYEIDGQAVKEVITEEQIAAALATTGSKFYRNKMIDGPQDVLELVRKIAMSQALRGTLPVLRQGEKVKIFFSHRATEPVGSSGLVRLDDTTSDYRVTRNPRGTLQEDLMTVNVIHDYPPSDCFNLAAFAELREGKISLLTAYPGTLSPDFPERYENAEAREYAREYWSRHAFVG